MSSHHTKTVELVLVLALILYNTITWFEDQTRAGNDAHALTWRSLLQDSQAVVMHLVLPSFFVWAGWTTASTLGGLGHKTVSLVAAEASTPKEPAWKALLVARAREEGIFLLWYLGGSLFTLFFVANLANERVSSLWDYSFLRVNGHLLYFSVYISFVRLLSLPFLVVAQMLKDDPLPPPSQISKSLERFALPAVFALALLCGFGWIGVFLSLLIGTARYLHSKGVARNVWLALQRQYTFLVCRDDTFQKALMLCTCFLILMFLWANTLFGSFLINIGLTCIFAAPLYLLYLSTCAVQPNLPKTMLNPTLLILLSIICGYLVVIIALPNIHFDVEALPSFRVASLLPNLLAVTLAQYFFALTFHLSLFLLGFYWTFVEERIPSMPLAWRSLASVALSFELLLAWTFMVPSPNDRLYLIGGLATCTSQTCRFSSTTSSFYYMLWFLYLTKVFCNKPNISPMDKLLHRTRFGLLFLHSALTHLCGSLVLSLQHVLPLLEVPPINVAVTWLVVVVGSCFASSWLPRSWLTKPTHRQQVSEEIPSHIIL